MAIELYMGFQITFGSPCRNGSIARWVITARTGSTCFGFEVFEFLAKFDQLLGLLVVSVNIVLEGIDIVDHLHQGLTEGRYDFGRLRIEILNPENLFQRHRAFFPGLLCEFDSTFVRGF